jgi:serine/threonine protein kinase
LERSPLSIGETTELVESLAGALGHLHTQNILHHDLKPSNIFCCQTGRIVLLDLGVAAAASHLDASSRTFLYSAPEVNRHEECDPRADLYSLGLVLFECLTGVRALEATSLPGAIHEQSQMAVPDPRDMAPLIPHSLATLCQDLTAATPSARPENAGVVLAHVQALRTKLAGEGENEFSRELVRGKILELTARQEFDLALALLKRYRETTPRSAWGPWIQARIQSQRGRYIQSLEALNEAQDLGLANSLVKEHEVLCYLQAGRNLEAYGRLRDLARDHPEDTFYRGLIEWLERA